MPLSARRRKPLHEVDLHLPLDDEGIIATSSRGKPMDRYPYTSLSQPRGQTRTLVLYPPQSRTLRGGQPLNCRFKTIASKNIKGQETPPYEASSHIWGNSETKGSVRIWDADSTADKGKLLTIKISQSLENCLKTLRYEDEGSVL